MYHINYDTNLILNKLLRNVKDVGTDEIEDFEKSYDSPRKGKKSAVSS